MGVYGTTYDNFPLGQMVDKALRVQTGQATVHVFIDELLGFIESGKLVADDICGMGDELLRPFRFSRFAEGKLHPTSNSPFPWS